MPEWTQRLASINDVFRAASHNVTDPEDVWSTFFIARCQSAFLAGSVHARHARTMRDVRRPLPMGRRFGSRKR